MDEGKLRAMEANMLAQKETSRKDYLDFQRVVDDPEVRAPDEAYVDQMIDDDPQPNNALDLYAQMVQNEMGQRNQN